MTTTARSPVRQGAKETQEAVLDAAEARLQRYGSEGLSVRGVAADTRISVGNLQYYFPTRASLLDAVFARHAEEFRDRIRELTPPSAGPRDELLAIVDTWLDVQDTEGQSLFWHLWAVSAHDESARETMTTLYDELLNQMAELLRTLHPNLGAADALRRVAMIGALIDGSGLFVGFGRRPRAALKALPATIRAEVVAMIDRTS